MPAAEYWRYVMFLLNIDALEALSQIITTAVEQLGYLGIFVGMVLSSTPLPLPSEIIMPYAGYIVWKGDLTLIGVTLAGTLGCLAGSLLDYVIGIFGGRPFLKRYGKYILVQESRLDDAERWFIRYGGRAVLICKLLPLTGIYISFLAGIFRMDVKKFTLYTAFGSLLWCLALVYIGLLLGPDWNDLAELFGYLYVLVIIGIIGVIGYLIYRYEWQPSHGQM
ncbi:MAG: DedA family protein [Halobacteriota archaeon]